MLLRIAFITNNGVITDVVVIVIEGSTITTYENTIVPLNATVTVDGILVKGGILIFTVNGNSIVGSFVDDMFVANYTVDFTGTQTVTANYDNAKDFTVVNGTIFATSGHSFYDLNELIRNSNGTVVLTEDYVFDNITDMSFVEGILIDRDISIIGNNHTVDANGQARIFYVYSGGSLTLDNMTLTNGIGDKGGVIFTNNGLTAINVIFINNMANYGGALFVNNSEQVLVDSSTFIQNNANMANDIYNTGNLVVNNSTLGSGEVIYNEPINKNNLLTLIDVAADDYAVISNYGTLNATVTVVTLEDSVLYAQIFDNVTVNANVWYGAIQIIGGVLDFTVNGTTVRAVYDVDYVFRANYTVDFVGVKEVTGVYLNNTGSNIVVAGTINAFKADAPSIIIISDLNTIVGETTNITVYVFDEYCNPIDGKITVYVLGEEEINGNVTDGIGSVDYTPTTAGVKSILIMYNSPIYNSNLAHADLTVYKANVTLDVVIETVLDNAYVLYRVNDTTATGVIIY
ncbi:MAG: hypothetical protein MJ209_01850 [archaeon]|nr:hypothetical protein [archaeon]